ncbi:hypothetical protein SmJEL517_g01118 [Synchytrium microbalum]|uniref:Uncharacterized protein n=1 Tax=Synchytrium microbalum TaxID=1806994 RepID=A0A507CC35_9FUNG|nr:uncharacterized protein SmJEL517_g01118 [Synchytrium microbalum]TPX37061.1 hypothetical protein SmJEL517_g01118 [Synchytrium microbalum]
MFNALAIVTKKSKIWRMANMARSMLLSRVWIAYRPSIPSVNRAATTIRLAHDSHDSHHPVSTGTESKLHPEELLKVARNWPHEAHYPGNFIARSGPEPGWNEPRTHLGHCVDNPTGGDTPKEDFSSSFWTTFLGLGVVMVAVWRLNDYATAGKEEHPIHTALKGYIPSMQDIEASTRDWVTFRQREADDRLLRQEWQPAKVWTPRFDGMFERASDWLITPGSQIDTSDVKFKHTWEKDDELFGAPYPKSA